MGFDELADNGESEPDAVVGSRKVPRIVIEQLGHGIRIENGTIVMHAAVDAIDAVVLCIDTDDAARCAIDGEGQQILENAVSEFQHPRKRAIRVVRR